VAIPERVDLQIDRIRAFISVAIAIIFSVAGLALVFGTASTNAQESKKISLPPHSTASIAGSWRGYYYYNDGRGSVPFQFQFQEQNGHCGSSSEKQADAQFGTECPVLHAFLDCSTTQLEPNKKIAIEKKYDGCGSQTHGVHYKGTISPDLREISGEWEIVLYGGTFLIRR